MKILAPSILSADFKKLGEEIAAVVDAGAQYIHIDVMDGIFVPSISFGMPVIKAVRDVTDKVFDVHLMISEPDRYIGDFAACGADIITVHAEACLHLDRTVEFIQSLGKKAGVALNPATGLGVLDYVLEKVDMVLLMSVNPGFGGQGKTYNLPLTVKVVSKNPVYKIRQMRKMIEERGLNTRIEVDGGINLSTAEEVLEAGADILVAGSAVFGGEPARRTAEFVDLMRKYR